jgi:hypothetical protein
VNACLSNCDPHFNIKSGHDLFLLFLPGLTFARHGFHSCSLDHLFINNLWVEPEQFLDE